MLLRAEEMEKLSNQIGNLYTELTTDDVEDPETQKTFDFSAIRDNFRQHIHQRRNAKADDLVLLDAHMVQNLITLKQKSFELLRDFRKASRTSTQPTDIKTFTSFEEFVNFTMNQEEILNSEIWKLEAIVNYINQLELGKGTICS